MKLNRLEEQEISDIINNGEIDFTSFKVQKNLNPKIFDKTNHIIGDIRKRLLMISDDFFNSLNIDWVDIEDVVLTGSLSNYNWSNYSDVDLHILIDFKEVNDNVELVKEYFDSKRTLWNEKHNITIKGYDVELYVQDINEPHVSSGVYSILWGGWIVKPDPTNKNIDIKKVKEKVNTIVDLINKVEKLYDRKEYQRSYNLSEKLKDKIKKMRQNGLNREGEYSFENVAFKVIRRSNLMEKLRDLNYKSYDKILSLSENKKVIKEQFDSVYLKRVSSRLEPPFFHNMEEQFGITQHNDQEEVLKYIYGDDIVLDHTFGDKLIKNYQGNNIVYYEYSTGEWYKWEYDENGNQIYYENSVDGVIRDNRNNITESKVIKEQKPSYNEKVSTILEPPYFINMEEQFGITDENDQEEVMKYIYGNDIVLDHTFGESLIQNYQGNKIYYEDKNGFWWKSEYDSWGNSIYHENSNGYWGKDEYDSKRNHLYSENSFGEWIKREFDSKGYQIYYEDNDGYWFKKEFDSNGNILYYENSVDGVIRDNR